MGTQAKAATKGKKSQQNDRVFDQLILLIKDVFHGIGGFINERQDILNKLEDHGIEITENKIRLLKKRRKYTESDKAVLALLTEEMVRNRQVKMSVYRKQIFTAMKSINDMKIKINKNAIREFESDHKTFKKAMKTQYGFFKSMKIIKNRNAGIDFEMIMNQKIDYYRQTSNIPLLEQMCHEIPIQYRLETKAFVDVMIYLKKINRNEENIVFINTQQAMIEEYAQTDFSLTKL